MSNQKEYPKLIIEQVIDIVIVGKSAKGLKEGTLKIIGKIGSIFYLASKEL